MEWKSPGAPAGGTRLGSGEDLYPLDERDGLWIGFDLQLTGQLSGEFLIGSEGAGPITEPLEELEQAPKLAFVAIG